LDNLLPQASHSPVVMDYISSNAKFNNIGLCRAYYFCCSHFWWVV